MGNILLSIITINYNNVCGLKTTTNSVVNQTWKEFEYILIDGGSIDGSKEYIESLGKHFAYWVSEKDLGIYNAMNKGIINAHGKYLLFLNSGDYLNDKFVLEKIFLRNDFSEDLLYGDIKTLKNGKAEIKKTPKTISMDYLLNHSLPHSATFYKRTLFQKYGYYNENNKIISDWEFNLKIFVLHNINYRNLDILVSVFDLNGISSQPASDSIREKEGKNALRGIFSPIILDYILQNKKIKSEFGQLKKSKIIQIAIKLRKIKRKWLM